jgi:hypothetical protein
MKHLLALAFVTFALFSIPANAQTNWINIQAGRVARITNPESFALLRSNKQGFRKLTN